MYSDLRQLNILLPLIRIWKLKFDPNVLFITTQVTNETFRRYVNKCGWILFDDKNTEDLYKIDQNLNNIIIDILKTVKEKNINFQYKLQFRCTRLRVCINIPQDQSSFNKRFNNQDEEFVKYYNTHLLKWESMVQYNYNA